MLFCGVCGVRSVGLCRVYLAISGLCSVILSLPGQFLYYFKFILFFFFR